jgi:hypothetical protein
MLFNYNGKHNHTETYSRSREKSLLAIDNKFKNKSLMGHIAHLSNIGSYENTFRILILHFISFCPTWPSGAMILTNLLMHYVRLIDWLIIYGFTSRSRIFYLYGDVTFAGEWLQNLGLCSAPRAFKQGGIFIVPHLLWHGTSVFPVSSEGPPYSVASYDTGGDVEDLF